MAAIAIAAPAAAGSPGESFVGYPNAKGSLGNSAGHGGFGSGGGFHVGFGTTTALATIAIAAEQRATSDSGGVWVNGGEWAHYNNRTFAKDSYNDWWHDEPNRSQPAWVRNNQQLRPPVVRRRYAPLLAGATRCRGCITTPQPGSHMPVLTPKQGEASRAVRAPACREEARCSCTVLVATALLLELGARSPPRRPHLFRRFLAARVRIASRRNDLWRKGVYFNRHIRDRYACRELVD